MAEGFLELLLGIHDIRVNDGSILPRRNVLNFVHGFVDDDPSVPGGETQVFFGDNPIWLPTVSIAVQQDNYTDDGISDATDVPFSPTVTFALTGVVSANITTLRKRIWHVGDANVISIENDDAASDAENRILTPGGVPMIVNAGNAALLLYDSNVSKWRALPCLA